MAESTKKTTKEAVEIKGLDQLREALVKKQHDLVTTKRSHRAGELVNPRVLGTIRKEIARLHTAIRAEVAKKESK